MPFALDMAAAPLALTASQQRQFVTDGYIVLPAFIQGAELAATVDGMDAVALEQQQKQGLGCDFQGSSPWRVANRSFCADLQTATGRTRPSAAGAARLSAARSAT